MGFLSRRDDDDWGPRVTWSTSSEKDPRFNMEGGADGVLSSAWVIEEAVKKKEAALGVSRPDDLEAGAWKK